MNKQELKRLLYVTINQLLQYYLNTNNHTHDIVACYVLINDDPKLNIQQFITNMKRFLSVQSIQLFTKILKNNILEIQVQDYMLWANDSNCLLDTVLSDYESISKYDPITVVSSIVIHDNTIQ